MVPKAAARWDVEMPKLGGSQDDIFGSCRGIEGTYERIKQIGEGTYGQVYLARDLQTGDSVALKKIRMDNEKEGFPITAIREIKLLSTLHHENVIRLREIVRSQVHQVNNFKGSIYMVCDYMDHDLTGLMERRNYKFSIPQIKCYMKQLFAGLAYCHKQMVLHRDLKASNLLINNDGCLKLADFGLARPFKEQNRDGKLTTRVITLWYRPPELILGADVYGPEVDVWSVGCILAEMLLGKPLFPGKDEADQLAKISALMGAPCESNMPLFRSYRHHHLVPNDKPKKSRLRELLGPRLKERKMTGAVELLEKLLALDPAKRMSAHDALFEKEGFFWSQPLACKPGELPTFEASHEMDMKAKRHAAKEAAQGRHPPAAGPDPKRQRVAGPQRQHYDSRQQGMRAPQGAPPPSRHPDGTAASAPPPGGYGGAYSQAGPAGRSSEQRGYAQYPGDRGPGGGGYPQASAPARPPPYDGRGVPPPQQYAGTRGGHGGRDAPPAYAAQPPYRVGGAPPPTQYPASAPQHGQQYPTPYGGAAPPPYGQPQAGGYGGGAGVGPPAAGAYGQFGAAVAQQLGPGAAPIRPPPGGAPPPAGAPRMQAGRPPPAAGAGDWSSQRR